MEAKSRILIGILIVILLAIIALGISEGISSAHFIDVEISSNNTFVANESNVSW